MKRILTFLVLALMVINIKATDLESDTYYLYAYNNTKSADIYIPLTSTDGDMYSATGYTFNSSTDLSSIKVVYGNWATTYAPEANTWPEVTLGSTITLTQGGTGGGYVYGWTLAESNYIYFQLSTLTLAISADATNPITSSSTTANAAMTALLKADSWDTPVASYYCSSSDTYASSSKTLTCVSPGYYLVNIPAGIKQIKFSDSGSNSATVDYPSGNYFVYDVSASAWDDEAYQAYDSNGAETTSSDDEAYGLYYKYYVGYTYAEISGLSYTDADNGLALTLPETVANGAYTVTGVGAAAFSNNTSWNSGHTYTGKLSSVTFNAKITYISTGAFNNCEDLTEVTFVDGLTDIGTYAFQNCTGLEGVRLPSTLTSLWSGDYGCGTFQGCTGLKWVDFKDCASLTSLGESTFAGCNYIETLYVSNTLDEIPSSTFGTTPSTIYCGITPAKALTTFTSCLEGYYADFSSVSGLTAYYAEEENDEGTAIVMQPVTDTAAQGDGLVLSATAGTYYNIPLTTTEGTAISSNMLVGNTSNDAFTVSDGMYFLSDGEFCVADSEGTLAKGKAYLNLGTSNSAKTFSISFADPTGIENLQTEQSSNEAWYTISGQQVDKPSKGLYIKNGKKVIIR